MELTACTALLADCSLTGGNGGYAGGRALVNNGAIAVDLRNTTLTSGQPPVSVSVGPLNAAAPLVRLEVAPPWLRGTTSHLTCRGDPLTFFVIALAPDSQPTNAPFVVEPVWFTGGAAVVAGVLDLGGSALVPVNVPNVPSLEHLTVWCQAVSGNALPLRASTLTGGVVQ